VARRAELVDNHRITNKVTAISPGGTPGYLDGVTRELTRVLEELPGTLVFTNGR
jgi:hypothetical protein